MCPFCFSHMLKLLQEYKFIQVPVMNETIRFLQKPLNFDYPFFYLELLDVQQFERVIILLKGGSRSSKCVKV